MNILGYLSYPPILRGLLVLLVAGTFFPLTGVFVLKLDLVTLRFMLMHGTILGAAVALALGVNPVLLSAGVNVGLIGVIAFIGGRAKVTTGTLTTFFMVLTIGLAFAVIYRFGVPAKDTLGLLWGNLYAMTWTDATLTIVFSLFTLLLLVVFYGKLRAVLYSREIAFSAGINAELLYNGVLVITGLTVAFAVKLIGALLLDALLLLPAIVSSFFARSTRQLFLFASVTGLCGSMLGFVLSLFLDIPVSSAVTVVTAVFLAAGLVIRRGTL